MRLKNIFIWRLGKPSSELSEKCIFFSSCNRKIDLLNILYLCLGLHGDKAVKKAIKKIKTTRKKIKLCVIFLLINS